MTVLSDPLELPCGVVLPNRLVRAAMTESVADRRRSLVERPGRMRRAAQERAAR